MGASRKLQVEIDRVLKKVHEGVDEFDTIWDKVHGTENVNLKEKLEGDLKREIKKLQRHRDQIKTWQQSSEIKDKKALMDARKLIEREMEIFKVFEKETKTKAFSKEGLGQQPKTDPREKAKSETRDWLNTVVGDLENQIDNFEAELEGISVKKGKTRNQQLTNLETSIARHKAHVMKLELILRLLDNDELSPDEVNDIKEFLDEYVECNQVNFDSYSNVDDLYATLPLDKVEALEDMVTLGTSGLVKAVLHSSSQQNVDQVGSDEILAQDSNSDATVVSSPKCDATVPMVPLPVSPSAGHVIMEKPNLSATSSASNYVALNAPVLSAIVSAPLAVPGIPKESTVSLSSSVLNSLNSVKEETNHTFSASRSSPIIMEIALKKGISRETPNQETVGVAISLTSDSTISSNEGLGSAPAVSDLSKRNVSSIDESIEGGSSPSSSQIPVQQTSKIIDGTNSNDTHTVGEGSPIGGRVFSLKTSDWRPQSATLFKTQNEDQIRGRPEIAPDQREKYLQRLQQVQQQGHSTLLSAPHLQGGNYKQFHLQQENSFLQQFNAQSMQSQLGLGLNIQPSAPVSVAASQLSNPMHQLPSQNSLISAGANDVDIGHSEAEDLQQQQRNIYDNMIGEPFTSSGLSKITSDDYLTSPLTVPDSAILTDGYQLSRDINFLPGQPLQDNLSSASPGVIGRSVPDLRTIGDNLGGSAGNPGGLYDPIHNMQLLEAALYRLPQPKDSEFLKSYTPRHPVVTPASFPQTRADMFKNPAFWNRLGLQEFGTDTLFFAFYHQQNTYQQYLAARELKRLSWRYHKQYSLWFQRHQEPDVTTDDYEKGTYIFFDYRIADNSPHHGWYQQIKSNFTFEYKYLEDDLVV